MHDTVVEMRDGRRYAGPLATWRPEDGWSSLMGDDDVPDRFWLRDCMAVYTPNERIPGVGIGTDDLLERARAERSDDA